MAYNRDSQGKLFPNQTRFPSGIKALSDFVMMDLREWEVKRRFSDAQTRPETWNVRGCRNLYVCRISRQ